MQWDPQLPDFFTNAIHVTGFEDLNIVRFTGKASSNSKNKAAIMLTDGKGFRITDSSVSPGSNDIIMKNVITEK
jgi:hypothetical protein